MTCVVTHSRDLALGALGCAARAGNALEVLVTAASGSLSDLPGQIPELFEQIQEGYPLSSIHLIGYQATDLLLCLRVGIGDLIDLVDIENQAVKKCLGTLFETIGMHVPLLKMNFLDLPTLFEK